MIKQLDKGVRMIELGQGTTFVSQLLASDNDTSSGIAFSNNTDGTIGENGVIIEITNYKGVCSYIKAIVGLLESWNLEGTEESLKELQKLLAKEISFEKN